MKRTFVLLLALSVASPLLAAGFTLKTETGSIYLRVDEKGAMCNMRQLESGGWEASCSDGPSEVIANSLLGCLGSTGTGYCGTAKPPRPASSFNQLLCPSGKSYYLSTGIQAENSCRINLEEGWKRCESADLENYAEANCKTGCAETGGAGACCIDGTPDCPFETIDDE